MKSIIDAELIEAAKNGNYERIAELLAAGADANAKDDCGRTAGHWAALNGHAGCLEVLIENGLDVNVKNNYGWTAGYLAAKCGNADCLKLLEEAMKKQGEKCPPVILSLHFFSVVSLL